MASSYKIATTLAGITSLDLLATKVVDPRGTFKEFQERVTLGDGTVRGTGWKSAEWHWDFIKRAMRDQLRTFCPGASAVVYITTKTNDSADSFATYKAVMIWPDELDKPAGRRMDFTIQFQRLEVQS